MYNSNVKTIHDMILVNRRLNIAELAQTALNRLRIYKLLIEIPFEPKYRVSTKIELMAKCQMITGVY